MFTVEPHISTPLKCGQHIFIHYNPSNVETPLLLCEADWFTIPLAPAVGPQKYCSLMQPRQISTKTARLLENVEHCGGEPEQAANMHMNRLSFTLK